MTANRDSDDSEPIFRAISSRDPAILAAVQRARSTAANFRELIANRSGPGVFHSAKLRFVDSNTQGWGGEPQAVNLWVMNVTWAEDAFVGTLYDVPRELSFIDGEIIRFQGDDLLDWMVLDNGDVWGAYSIRVIRDLLPEDQRADYDRDIGAERYLSDP